MSRTNCLTHDELADFHVGELAPALLEELAGHMETCAHCEAAARAFDSVSNPLLDAYRRSAQSGRMTSTPRSPQQVGDYEILDEIGRGGMGIVYRARHRRLQRVVALKMLLGGTFALHDEIVRFRTEAEAVARLQHPHIVQIYEIGEYEGDSGVPRPYFTLEFVEGGSLSFRTAGRPQPAGQAAAWIETLARATHYAHGQGIIHRDLKPGNVLLTADGQPKICDFGVAKLLANSELKTQSGMLVGTAEYMAPEQAVGNASPGPAVDIYALGAILYTLLTGRPPFQGVSPLHTLEQVRNQEPVTPGRLQPRIPRDLETICLKCLEKEPAKRYASAIELADDLRQFLCDEPIRARRATIWERTARWVRRHKTVTLALAAVLLSMAIATAISTYEAVQKEAERVKARDAESAAVAAKNLAQEERDRVARNLYVARTYLVGQSLDTPAGLSQVARLFSDWRGRSLRNEPRGWEWYYFQTLANRGERTLHGHAHDVTSLAWNPDGSRLASGSLDGTMRLWDTATGIQLARYSAPSGILSLGWSADGRRFVTADYPSRTLTIWDAKSGTPLHSLPAHPADIWWVAWSPDNKHFASVDADGAAHIWDDAHDSPLFVLKGAGNPKGCLSWSPDGKRLAVANSPTTVTVWDVSSGKQLNSLIGHQNLVTCVAWCPSGKCIATLDSDQGITIWDANSGKAEKKLPVSQQEGFPGALSWNPDGRRLAVIRLDLAIAVHDVESGHVQLLRGHTNSHVSMVCWSPDGKRLASAERGWNAVIKIWNTDAVGEQTSFAIGGETKQIDMVWSPDSRMLATGHVGGDVRIWDTSTHECRLKLNTGEPVWRVSWSPDGRYLASSGANGTLSLWDPIRGELKESRPADGNAINSLTWSKDCTKIGYGKARSEFGTWNLVSGTAKEFKQVGIRGTLRPQGDKVAAGLSYGVRIVDADTGKEITSWRNREVSDNFPQWDPQGLRVATLSDFAVEIRDAATGKIPFPPLAHSRRVVLFAWSPNSKQMVTCTEDHDVHLWDAVEGNPVLSLRGPGQWIIGLAWSPDSTRIAVASRDGRITIWDATAGYASERAPALLEALNKRLENSTSDREALRLRAGVFAHREDWDSAAQDAERLTADNNLSWFQAGWWIVDSALPAGMEPDPFEAATDSSSAACRWYVSADDPNGFVPLQVNESTYLSRVYSPRAQALEMELTAAQGLDAHLWLNGDHIDASQKARLQLAAGWNALAVRVEEEQTQSSNVLLRPGNGFYLRLRPVSDD